MSSVHGDVGSAIVEARLKYLQRVPFPASRRDVGKGGRTYYSADDLMRLAVVFELIAASLLPAQSAALVDERWTEISTGLASAWTGRSSPAASVLMLAIPNTFDVDGLGAGRVDIRSVDEVAIWLKHRRLSGRKMAADGHRPQPEPRATLVDLVALATALDEALSASTQVPEFVAMKSEVDAWVASHRGDQGKRT